MEFTGYTSPRTLALDALNQSNTDYGRTKLVFAPGSFDFANTYLTISTKSNVEIAGCGIGVTTLLNASISKHVSSGASSNIHIHDMTIDCNNATSWGINISDNTTDAIIERVWIQNSADSYLLKWETNDNLRVRDCVFIDAGISFSAENVEGNQLTSNERMSVFSNCYFKKTTASTGGDLIATPPTGNLLISGCKFENTGTTADASAAVRITNTAAATKDIFIHNCHATGPNMALLVGNSSANAIRRVIMSNNITDGGYHYVRGATEAIISGCIAMNTEWAGFYTQENTSVKLSNCIAKNTNTVNNATTTDRGGFYGLTNVYTEIDGLTVRDDSGTAGTANYTPHGIRAENASAINNIKIRNCNLIGPFTSAAIRLDNYAVGRIKGGEVPSGATLTFNTVTSLDVREIRNYNPRGLANITAPGTGVDYTNNDGVPEMVYAFGGTITSVLRNAGATQVGSGPNVPVWLEPGQTVRWTYTGTPTFVKDMR